MIYIYLLHFSESKLFHFIISITCNYKSHQIWSERRLRQISLFFLLCENRVPKRPPPSPLEKKSKSLHGTSIISKHAQYVHSVESAPTYMYVDSRSWLETTMFMFLMPVPSTPTPPPPLFFEKFLDPRHDVVLVLHFCGLNCQYMYRYMYMHPPPTPTKYRLFTIRKHAFLSLFLNDASCL